MNRETPLHARVRTQGQRIKRQDRREMKRQFLIEYAQHPIVQQVCLQIGISRSGFYAWLQVDERFKAKYEALSAVYYDIWFWSNTEEWTAHLKRRRVGHRLIRYYLKKDILVQNHQTIRDVARAQKRFSRACGMGDVTVSL